MASFEDKIRNWVQIDNQLKTLNDQTRELRERKTQLTRNIHNYTQSNNLANSTVNISDGRLRFGTMQTQQALTFRFLEQCLSEIIPNQESVQQILSHIKNKREVKSTPDIKRYYSDN